MRDRERKPRNRRVLEDETLGVTLSVSGSDKDSEDEAFFSSAILLEICVGECDSTQIFCSQTG